MAFEGSAKVGEVYICFMLSLLSMPTDLRYVLVRFFRNDSLVFSYFLCEGSVSAKEITDLMIWPTIGKKLSAVHKKWPFSSFFKKIFMEWK